MVLFILIVPLSCRDCVYDPPNPAAPGQEVFLATLKQIVRMLEEQRRELLDQLDGIDRAIAALGDARGSKPRSRVQPRPVFRSPRTPPEQCSQDTSRRDAS